MLDAVQRPQCRIRKVLEIDIFGLCVGGAIIENCNLGDSYDLCSAEASVRSIERIGPNGLKLLGITFEMFESRKRGGRSDLMVSRSRWHMFEAQRDILVISNPQK